MKINISELENACEDQRILAQKAFGNEIEITAKNIRLAVKVGLNINWAVRNLNVFAPIRAEYNAKVSPIRAEYNAKVSPIRAEYDAKVDSIWAEYDAKVGPIRAEYDAKVDPIWAKYNSKCGECLIDILNL